MSEVIFRAKPVRPIKYVIFNAPPRSGKDTVKKMMEDWILYNVKGEVITTIMTFSDVLKESCCSIYSISWPEWVDRYDSDEKDVPWDRLFGLTQREAMIKLAESHLKPLHGDDVMVKLFLQSVEYLFDEVEVPVIVFCDVGFQNEYDTFINEVGSDNAVIIYIERDGCDYSFDSRSHVHAGQVISNTIKNNSDIGQLRMTSDMMCEDICKDWGFR